MIPLYGWVAFAILGTGLLVLVLGGGGNLWGVDPGQLAAVTAMLALLVYLGGGMVGRRSDLGPLARQLAVWGVLLALLIGGYLLYESFFTVAPTT